MEKRCSQEELDSWVASEIESDGSEAVPFQTIDDAKDYLSVAIDLEWPDVPFGFTAEEFMESYNRQLKETAQK